MENKKSTTSVEKEKVTEIEVVDPQVGNEGAKQIFDKTNIKEKKEQKVSISYTLKSLRENIRKLEENKIATKDECEELKKLHKKCVERWIGLEMGI